MNAKQLFALSFLSLATGAVFADSTDATPLTRVEVRQSVLAARAAGTLTPAGEGVTPVSGEPASTMSALSHTTVDANVLEARSDGTLRHTGSVAPEEKTPYKQMLARKSTLARANVRAQVLEARADHTLVPAGEAADPSEIAFGQN